LGVLAAACGVIIWRLMPSAANWRET